MANYYLDDNGKITTKKRNQRKKGKSYILGDDGRIKEVEALGGEEDIAPVRETAKKEDDSISKRTKFEEEALTSADFEEYAKKGLSAKNPSVYDASKGFNIGSWMPFAEELQNPVTFLRENPMSAAGNLGESGRVNVNWQNMTDDEVKIYSYYLAKKGKEAASAYLESIEDDLAKRQGEHIAKGMNGNAVAEVILAGGAGFESARQGLTIGLKNLVTGSENVVKPTATMYADTMVAEDNTGVMQAAHDVSYGVGNMVPSVVVGAFNPAAGAAVLGAGVAGNKYNQNIAEGLSVEEAQASAILNGISEAGSQYAMGGIGKLGGKALSKILSKVAPKTAAMITGVIANVASKTPRIAQAIGHAAVEMGKEGAEEALQTYLEPLIDSWVTEKAYEAPDFDEVVYNALIGALTSAGLEGAPSVAGATIDTIKGKPKSNLTANEKAVIDKEVEKRIEEAKAEGKKLSKKEEAAIAEQVEKDMEKGRISTDTIEEVLGGETYETYKKVVDNEDALSKEEEGTREEFNTLNRMKKGDMTGEQTDRLEELRTKLTDISSRREKMTQGSPREALKARLGEEVSAFVKNDRLIESYNEKARRSQAFEADLEAYSPEQRKVVEKAVKSGILNNTNRTHEFVDIVAKISADKGVLFDFTNNERLKASGFSVEGTTVNGYITKDGIAINMDSPKAWQSTVGHEITHVLEGTEVYTELQTALFEYAKAKKDYQGRYDTLAKLYKGKNVEAELTADLVGDYLFTDESFVNSLSTKHRNVFQKIYDEIKYLAKIVTAGSKEARQLEKVKRAFEKDYKAQGKPSGEIRYALKEYTDHQKKNWESSKRIVVYNDNAQLSQFIQESITNKTMDKKMYFGAIPSDLAGKIQSDTGINVENYNLSLGSNEIRKILKDHGNEATEALRGQRAITADDFSHVMDVVLNPTSVKLSEKTYMGKPAIVFTGNHNGRMNVVAVVSDKRLDLFVQTIYANTKKENLSTPIGEQAPINTPEASSGTVSSNGGTALNEGVQYSNISDPSDTSISQNSEKSSGDVKKSLSAEQQAYFKDSVVRDENGNLKVMYHGTSKGGHAMFDPYGKARYGLFGVGSYFTDSKAIAESYTKKGKGNQPQVYETYLNITNPIDMDAPAVPAEWKRAMPDVDFPKSGTNEDFYRAMEEYFEGNEYPRWEASETAMEVIEGMGYDGITHIGGGRVNADGERHQVYIAFQPEQIKNIDNAKPTSDPDIRYSLSEDSEGRGLNPAVQKRFENSKAIDENGNLKVLYHGTASGEFSVFDKSKGSVEGDFGSGFYFTDNESDVSNNYEGGGPDFDNKVARRAEQIEAEEDIDYDEAEERARKELYKGSHKFEVYLNIENPAIVGETMLFDNERYLSEYNEEDFDDYDEYIAEVDQLLADDIDKIVWEVDRNTGLYSTDGIAEVLYEAYAEGGIGIEELKSKINDLYLEDENGNLVGNEVTRQIIESLGYDGIIDPTVSTKWNMDMEEGTTHYIVFRPNQIKAVTNQNPTDNPDIHRSLSGAGQTQKRYGNFATPASDLRLEAAPVREDIAPAQEAPVKATTATAQADEYAPISEAEATALQEESLASLSDADAPPEAEAPYYEESEDMAPDDPFEDRDIKDVGNRKVKAYMYENPEVKPFFQEEAGRMLRELDNTIKGERLYMEGDFGGYGAESYYRWVGISRQTTEDIAYLLDEHHYTYDEIRKGLNAIIEDNGKENNAVSKRIEFLLNDRLLKGYRDDSGYDIPPNQDYVNLLNEKQITEYNEEAQKRLFETADQFAPPAEDIDPVKETVAEKEPVATLTVKNAGEMRMDFDEGEVTMGENDQDQANAIAARNPKYPPVAEKVGEMRMDFEKGDVVEETREPTVARKALHESIILEIKSAFSKAGFNFDKVLQKAKDLSTFATVDNTPQRVMDKSLGYEAGHILADLTVNKVAQNETEGIRWLNSFTDPKNGMLARISKEYHIKPGSKKSAAAQMYAEGFYVDENNNIIAYGDKELAADFPNILDQINIKGLANDQRIRRIYDETLEAINASRRRNGYPEIPRLDNYYLHFRAMEDTFSRLGLPFNPNDIRAKDLPTDLNGVTADLKPGQPYFASAKHRKGKRTSFDLLGGLEKYLSSAKNQIYHIDDIQTLRALRNYIADTFGQAHGLENLDSLSDEEAEARIKEVFGAHLSTFAKFLNEEANVIAGKTSLVDRGIEGIIGRRGIATLDAINRQVGANMVGLNLSSSLTNFLSVVQATAKSNKLDVVKAYAQTVANRFGSLFGKGDGFADASPVMVRRKGIAQFHRTPWQKASDGGYVLMSAVDGISTELIARMKFNELTRKGVNEQEAHIETDKWVSRLMGDRSLGQQPQLFNSKMLGLVTKFQLEVRNQLDSQFYDTFQETKASTKDIENGLARNAIRAAKITATMVELAVLQHVFGMAFEAVAGYNPAFDIIDAIIKAFGFDDEEGDEDTALDNIEEGFLSLLGDLPYTSTFTGGRMPIESALPVEQFFTGKDKYGNEKNRLETLAEAAPYYLLPGGYSQIKKTVQGLGMFDDEHPVSGSYTKSGNLRFPVEDTPLNRAQAALFGQWASGNARDYFDNERSPLKKNQIEEFMSSGMKIQDYWDYREGLSDYDKLEDKADYINSLDVPIGTKNLLINNQTDRKTPIDMTDYDLYDSLEEFDFANDNPERYDFFIENGITYEDYKSADEKGKKAYTWAYENPEKFKVAKLIENDVVQFRKYTSEIAALESDKDEDGDPISGSVKAKAARYIDNLNIDYGQKLIFFKFQYKKDDTYNYEILDYLYNKDDVSYEDKVAILKELGFAVSKDGNVTW